MYDKTYRNLNFVPFTNLVEKLHHTREFFYAAQNRIVESKISSGRIFFDLYAYMKFLKLI